MSRESHRFFNVVQVKAARIAAVSCCCLAILISAGCSSEKQIEKTPEKKQEKVVTEMNIQTDADVSESAQEKKDDLETLPFDDESGKGADESALPSLNGPD